MNIQIEAVRDAGDLNQERLVLKVTEDTDVGGYAVFGTAPTPDGEVSNVLRHAYWFPDKPVRAGDLVILYSKGGAAKEKPNKTSNSSHFFYWDLDKAIWDENEDRIVLLSIAEWASAAPKTLSR